MLPKKKTTPIAKSAGVSLIELLVALAIGMVLAIVASSVYLYSKQTFNTSSETTQIEENGRFALNLLTKYIQSAGFVMIDPTNPAPQGPIDNKISGCTFGLTNGVTPTSATDLGCRASTPAGNRRSESISLFAETDAYNGSGTSFQGYDCLGLPSIPMGGTINETRSHFFVSTVSVQTQYGLTTMGQLTCASDRTPTTLVPTYQSQPLIPGIEQIAFLYQLPSTADPDVAQAGLSAASMTAAQWRSVLAVDVCVLAKSIQSASNDSGTAYTDCYGTAITAVSGEIYRVFRTTVRLRNKTAI